MKITPKKPHFFKPILPGFKHGLKIPIGFLKYLKGLKHIKHAILRRAGRKWLVKVNCWRLEDGWKKFAKEHDLQLGDLLVFRHEGNMEFKVSIFDSSHCDREYTEYLQEEEEDNNVEETSKNVQFKEAATHNPCGQSRFECIVRPYCITNGFLRLPRQFARANGLMNKKCGVIIRDEKQRSWNLRLATYDLSVRVFDGWDDFCIVNNLKAGDYMMFEVVANGEKPIWKFHSIKNLMHKTLDVTTPISQIPASTSADANPHFISTIKHYTFTKAILCFPKDFAKSNGLMDKHEMILVDEKQRSWTVWLGQMDHCHFGIKSGWPQFRKAIDVQVGDTYKFELTDNGTIPIMHVHCHFKAIAGCRTSGVTAPKLQVATSTSTAPKLQVATSTSTDASPHFIFTIKSYSIRKSTLYLPMAFAKSTGLVNGRCEIILIDEKHRSWSMSLGPMGHQFGIRKGWTKFIKANCFRVGDPYKFELINNGKIPVAYVQRKYEAVGDGQH